MKEQFEMLIYAISSNPSCSFPILGVGLEVSFGDILSCGLKNPFVQLFEGNWTVEVSSEVEKSDR